MAYPLPTTINGSGGLPEVLNYTNSVTGSWFSNMILISIFVIFLMAYYRSTKDVWGGLTVSSFATFIISMLFFFANFISAITFGISVGALIIFSAILFLTRN